MTTELKVTAQGVWIPRSLLDAWENVEGESDPTQDSIVREMKAKGLIETLPWEHPPTVSANERARLAKQLSCGKPLSTVILESREEYA